MPVNKPVAMIPLPGRVVLPFICHINNTCIGHVHRSLAILVMFERMVSAESQRASRLSSACCREGPPTPSASWLAVYYPSPRWGLVSNTSCWGDPKAPPEISQTTGPISKFQTPFDSPVRELPVQCQKFDLDVTDDVTGQVKVRIFDFSGFLTSASKISMLNANKANESAWIVSLTSVSIISCAL